LVKLNAALLVNITGKRNPALEEQETDKVAYMNNLPLSYGFYTFASKNTRIFKAPHTGYYSCGALKLLRISPMGTLDSPGVKTDVAGFAG
jgi:hypothetical protein